MRVKHTLYFEAIVLSVAAVLVYVAPKRHASLVAFLLLVSAALCVALARSKRLLRQFIDWYGLCTVCAT